jgi:hypothetical protein
MESNRSTMERKQQEQPLPVCQTFSKKEAMACYKLLLNAAGAFEHHELYRISSETPGEYYVFPIETLQKQVRRHLSYHRSGAFHWRQPDGSKIQPLDDEADERRASLLSQAMAHISGRLDGYCISKGRNVPDRALEVMIDIMDGYVIPPLKAMGLGVAMKIQKAISIPLVSSPYRSEAQRIVAEARKRGDSKLITHGELIELIKATAPNAKCLQPDPKSKRLEIFSQETMTRLIQIAHAMVSEKMLTKPNAFWADIAKGGPDINV